MDLGYPLPSNPNAPQPGAAFGAEAVAGVKRAVMAWPGDHGKPSPDVPGTGSAGRRLGILSCQGTLIDVCDDETQYGAGEGPETDEEPRASGSRGGGGPRLARRAWEPLHHRVSCSDPGQLPMR